LALAEDAMLAYGSLTPVEAQARRTELAALARSLPAASAEPSDAMWTSLARRALARAGVAVPAVEAPSSWAALASYSAPADDASAPLVRGTAALLGDLGGDVLRRFGEGSQALVDRLGPTGLVREGASAGERIESTALLLLALEVVFRTY
jgi:hypothetical protein